MKRYEIQIRNVAKKGIDQIKDFIIEKTAANTPSVTRLNFMQKCSH